MTDAIPIFYSTTGGLLAIISGVFTAMWVGREATLVAVKSTFNNGPGSTFYTYGGNSFMGDLLGFVEATYVVAYILFGAGSAAGSVELALKMNNNFKEIPADKQTDTNYEYLTYGLLLAIASYVGGLAITKSNELLLGFFDRQYTNAGDQASSLNQSTNVTNGNAILVDLIHHTLTIIAYYFVAVGISGGAYYYVYKAITPLNQQAF